MTNIKNDWHITQNEEYLLTMKDRLLHPKLIWVDQFIKIIKSSICEINVKINDFGCNVGHFYRGVIDMPVNYIGYDISETYINIAIENFGNFFEILDISSELPRKCNVSVISATLEHIEDYESVIKNIFENTENLVIIRTFIGDRNIKDFYHKENADQKYLIRQFTIGDIIEVPCKLGWKYDIIDDDSTNSIEKNIGGSINRTQKIIIFKK